MRHLHAGDRQDEAAAPRDARSPHAFARRRAVLWETVQALSDAGRAERYREAAQANVARWRAARDATTARQGHDPAPPCVGAVLRGDWGVVTRVLSEAYGAVFAVLNMANARHAGGGYREGLTAQEENLFRRTDCHFSVRAPEVDLATLTYAPEVTALLNAEPGRVYLDRASPRVCIRGPEDPRREDLGYAWLAADDVFPFYELRAAAQDLRMGAAFDEMDARRRIVAQVETLVDHGVRHAVLGAHGCGAFENPPERMARLYREELSARAGAFECVAFAIRGAGSGRDSYGPFKRLFG